MQGSLDSPPIVIRASRSYASIGFAVCSALLTILFLRRFRAAAHLEVNDYLWAVSLTFGFLLFASQLIKPSYLKLEPDGLTWSGPLKSRFWAWKDIGNFRDRGFGAVGCDLFANDSNFVWLRPFNRAAGGSDGAIGLGWEGGAAAVAVVLNDARARWLRA